jgi:isopropylmalate/homocitrate/citramalate synthase
MKVNFLDNTLRDGEQMSGLHFNAEAKLDIIQSLKNSGVDSAEIGFPAISENERLTIKKIVNLQLDMDLVGFCRPLIGDIDHAKNCGLKSIRLLYPKSKFYLNQLSITDLNYEISKCIEYAKKLDFKIRFIYEGASITETEEIIQIFKLVEESGVDLVSYADTSGIATPSKITNTIKNIKNEIKIPLAIHCHNDLGLAVANSIAAIESGASEVECCVNGIGERAGNAALEEIAIILSEILKIDHSILLSKIPILSKTVQKYLHYTMPLNKPIVGSGVFSHESGIHVSSILNGEKIYQAFDPRIVHSVHQINLGKHSNIASLKYFLDQISIKMSHESLKIVLSKIKFNIEIGIPPLTTINEFLK